MPALIILMLLISGWMVISTWISYERCSKIANKRRGENFETFVLEFEGKGVPRWIMRSTYEKLQKHMDDNFSSFPIRANDILEYPYGLVDELLEDIVFDVLSETGKSLPESKNIHDLETVMDLVYFVNEAPLDVQQEKSFILNHSLKCVL